ncbi:MAG: endonuclease/exonuclease/phosphatase family protein [Gammaproteobacteria bacterium]|nr:endonuclease/exonuclease/phosphatase family protein [Gammaproteobacteria bacterium]
MPQRSAISHFFIARCQWLVWLCALGALTAPVSRVLPADSLPRLQWLVELAAHWQWAYTVVGALALGVLVWGRRSRWLLLAALVLGGSFLWQPATLPSSAEPVASARVLTVGTANLNLATTDFAPLVLWLASADAPDVVMLQEFTGRAQSALASHPEVAARYPHRLQVPQPDPFGLAVLSRHPLTNLQTLQPQNEHDTLRLRATLAWQGTAVHLSALHPMPPLNAAYAQARDRALVQEALHIQQTGGLGVMAGDLNITPWTRGLFAIDAHMRRANGLAPSWPNAWGGWSVLPLDHVLASPGWQVVGSHAGPDLGSDHRPVVVQLAVTP